MRDAKNVILPENRFKIMATVPDVFFQILPMIYMEYYQRYVVLEICHLSFH